MNAETRATRRIAILAPMQTELRPLVSVLHLEGSHGSRSDLLWGSRGRIEIVAALTGVGMRAGSRRALQVLDDASPDHLVVVGIAGAIGPSVAVGDVVVPEFVTDLDSGRTFRPRALGGSRPTGTLASSDALLESPEQAARLAKRGVVAVDMETAAIGEACERRGCPWSVFRAISDRADDGTTDAAVLSLIDEDGNPKLASVARFVLGRPRRIAQLIRLARGTRRATRAAADAVVAALEAC